MDENRKKSRFNEFVQCMENCSGGPLGIASYNTNRNLGKKDPCCDIFVCIYIFLTFNKSG